MSVITPQTVTKQASPIIYQLKSTRGAGASGMLEVAVEGG